MTWGDCREPDLHLIAEDWLLPNCRADPLTQRTSGPKAVGASWHRKWINRQSMVHRRMPHALKRTGGFNTLTRKSKLEKTALHCECVSLVQRPSNH